MIPFNCTKAKMMNIVAVIAYEKNIYLLTVEEMILKRREKIFPVLKEDNIILLSIINE